MHASNTVLLAALASSAAAQVNVVHVLETMHLLPRSSSNAPADVLLARQGASLEECASSLSDIVKDMPTLPTEVIEYAVTATGPAPTDVCTQALPLSLSKPILDAVTAFAYWGADHSNEAMEWMAKCNEEDLAMPDDADPIMNPGDMMLPSCTEEEAVLLFTDSRTTQTVVVGSVISELGEEIMASISEAQAGGSATTTGVEASGTASGDAEAESTGAESSAATGAESSAATGAESSAATGAESSAATGAESSAATGAAESTGAGGDGGSGAVRAGLTGAGVAAMAGIVGLFVSL